jgi:hypothetical protein
MKQTGSNRAPWPGVLGKGENLQQPPADLRIRELPAATCGIFTGALVSCRQLRKQCGHWGEGRRMANQRGLRSGPLPDSRQKTNLAPLPVGRSPPFLLVPDPDRLVLITPNRKRRAGPISEEEQLVRALIERLGALPNSSWWIDPATGEVTPAVIGV